MYIAFKRVILALKKIITAFLATKKTVQKLQKIDFVTNKMREKTVLMFGQYFVGV